MSNLPQKIDVYICMGTGSIATGSIATGSIATGSIATGGTDPYALLS